MRLFALAAVALGCSSNSFDIAPVDAAADTDLAVDTMATDTAAAPTDTLERPDIEPPPDSRADSLVVDVGPGDVGPADVGPADVGVPCARTSDCGVNQYCKYAACGDLVGVCAALSPLPGPYYNPVCGCDGTTFWNKEYAFIHSVAVKHEEPCTVAERKTCGGSACDTADSKCVYQLPGASSCAAGSTLGACWRLPTGTACGTSPGLSMLPCDGSTCMNQCTAVKSGKPFYSASCTTI